MNLGLSDKLAHAIVRRVMEVIPHNVNIMNADGVIIASGEADRVGKLHQGALFAIQRNSIFEVLTETITEKMGVNSPIFYRDDLIGVIGISGEPERVRGLVHVIKVIAELMIEQQYAMNMDLHEKIKLDNFLYEWCTVTQGNQSALFLEQIQQRGIDQAKPRVAILLQVNTARSTLLNDLAGYLHHDEFLLRYHDSILVILCDVTKLDGRLKRLMQNFPQIQYIGVGNRCTDVPVTVIKAQKSLDILKKRNQGSGILHFEECLVYDMISSYEDNQLFCDVMNELAHHTTGDYLQQTVICYLKFNGNINRIVEELHIHRNTLSYRIQKIEEYTGKNLKNINDMFYFYVSCIANGKLL